MQTPLVIGIHPDSVRKNEFYDRCSEVLRGRGVEVRQLNLLAQDAIKQARACDGVAWHWSHIPGDKQSARQILYAIEHVLKIPVWPSSVASWHFDDKIAQSYLLESLSAPTPHTWIFWEREEALRWAESAPYPIVMKLSVGAGSANVILIRNAVQARKMIQHMFLDGVFPMNWNEHQVRGLFHLRRRDLSKLASRLLTGVRFLFSGDYPRLPNNLFWKPEFGYAYFQEFLDGNDFDTRVTVIGKRAFAFRRFNRKGDFRASGGGLLNYDIDGIDRRCIEIAFRVSREAGFKAMAYDFLVKDGQPVICEMSYGFVSKAVYACQGHWDEQLNWHTGQMWPEEAMMDEFLPLVEEAKRHRSGVES